MVSQAVLFPSFAQGKDGVVGMSLGLVRALGESGPAEPEQAESGAYS